MRNTAEIPGSQYLPGIIKPNYVFVGNIPFWSAFIKTLSKKELIENWKIFNYRLSRVRLIIKNTFGIFCACWQILNKLIKFSLINLEEVIKTLVCLHNYDHEEKIWNISAILLSTKFYRSWKCKSWKKCGVVQQKEETLLEKIWKIGSYSFWQNVHVVKALISSQDWNLK